MKKRTKRLLAMLLASTMILQQGSTMGVLATESEAMTEIVPETQMATQTPETRVETQTPETKAPETAAPETQASETQAPETKAPETVAPETRAETPAPETQVPETKAPETQAETPAPEGESEAQVTEKVTEQTTETVTEQPSEAETQTVTEEQTTEAEETQAATEETAGTTETPAAAESETATEAAPEKVTESAPETETEAPKTDFTYEDARVKITATAQAEANLPQDAQIHADLMQPGTPEYQAAAAALEAAYAGQNVVLDYVFYDIYFTAESAGEGRIEPEAGTVVVSMQFKQPELTADEDVEVQSYDVMHVEDGKAQEVPSTVQTTGDGSVASVGFTSDSFSPFAVVTVGTIGEVGEVHSAINKITDKQQVKQISMADLDKFVDETYFDAEKNEFTIHFSEKPPMWFEDVMTYNLPAYIEVLETGETGDFIVDGRKIGTYTITSGKLTLTIDPLLYDAVVEGGYVFDGYVTFSGNYENTKDEKKEVVVGTGSSTGELDPEKTKPELEQTKTSSIDWETGIITYTITVKAKNGDFINVNVVDTPSENLELFGNIEVKINDEMKKTFSSLEDLQSMNLELEKDQILTITYKMKVTDTAVPKVANSAVTSGIIGENTITAESKTDDSSKFTTQWFTKSGQKDGEDLSKAKWTLEVGKGYGKVAGVTVYDRLTEDSHMKYDKDQNIKVHIYERTDEYNYSLRETVELKWEDLTKNEEDCWEFLIPESLGSGPYDLKDRKYYLKFEYFTDLTPEEEGKTTHVNTGGTTGGEARDHTGGGTVESVGKQAEVSKSGKVNKEDSTITWTIVITVPATGLEHAFLSDEKIAGSYNTYFGEYLSGTVEFSSNAGEQSGKIDVQHQEYTNYQDLYVYFNADNKEDSNLKPSKDEKPYTVTVTYKTTINENIKSANKKSSRNL